MRDFDRRVPQSRTGPRKKHYPRAAGYASIIQY